MPFDKLTGFLKDRLGDWLGMMLAGAIFIRGSGGEMGFVGIGCFMFVAGAVAVGTVILAGGLNVEE